MTYKLKFLNSAIYLLFQISALHPKQKLFAASTRVWDPCSKYHPRTRCFPASTLTNSPVILGEFIILTIILPTSEGVIT